TLRNHLKAEATGDQALLLSTCAPDPQYHYWRDGVDHGPKGWDAISHYYAGLWEEHRWVVEYDIQRIIVDDDAIMTEGPYKQIYPGWALRNRGLDVDDPDAAYMISQRLVIIYPFDENGLMVGEDPYNDGNAMQLDRIRKLTPDEIPEPYFRSYPITPVAAA